MQLVARALTQEAFRSFGAVIVPPSRDGERKFYTEWLGSSHPGATPRFHINSLPKTVLPYAVTLLEKHSHSAQIFLPLEASNYLVVVAPSHADGSPQLDGAEAFIAPGTVGIVYAAGTWHAGATALHGKAHFAVQMWRNDVDDDVFHTLDEPLLVTLEAS